MSRDVISTHGERDPDRGRGPGRDPDVDPDAEERRRRLRRGVAVVGAVLVVALVAGAAAAGYRTGLDRGRSRQAGAQEAAVRAQTRVLLEPTDTTIGADTSDSNPPTVELTVRVRALVIGPPVELLRVESPIGWWTAASGDPLPLGTAPGDPVALRLALTCGGTRTVQDSLAFDGVEAMTASRASVRFADGQVAEVPVIGLASALRRAYDFCSASPETPTTTY